MRSRTFCNLNLERRVTVTKRNSIHSRRISPKPFWRGRPSPPIITRLIDALLSSDVCASSMFMNSVWSRFFDFGSNTRRIGASRPDSSRTVSSTARIFCFKDICSGDSAFFPSLTLGLVSSSISSNTFCEDVPGGSSVTTACHWPRAMSSIFQRARTFRLPRPLWYISEIAACEVMICPPAGKSGPGMYSISSACVSFGLRIIATAAFATSRRLCAGISVARPTAMPEAPFNSTKGRRPGKSFGSSVEPS